MFFGLNDVAFLAAAAGGAALDPDAAVYIAAVEAADTQALEPAVRAAINDFVVGCKADGIWPAIKASCILAGARTLTGALVPLAGVAPTNVNFDSGDYNRKTGLVGNGSNKYLSSNRANNADPQNSKHVSVFITATATGSTIKVHLTSEEVPVTGSTQIVSNYSSFFMAMRNNTLTSASASGLQNVTGLVGHSRSLSSSITRRLGGTTDSVASTSEVPSAGVIGLWSDVNGLTTSKGNARLAFYSIGESLDLALLDARVTALINAFDAAI
jgi:hypothetical protein